MIATDPALGQAPQASRHLINRANGPSLPQSKETHMKFTVTSDALELPRGSSCRVTPGPVNAGQLALVWVGDLPTIGRWHPSIAGFAWIVQPGQLIQVTGKVPVEVVGPVATV